MAENLLIRDLNEEALKALDYIKKKFDIAVNSKATLKMFEQYSFLEERNRQQLKRIDELEKELRDLKDKMSIVKEAFSIILDKEED